MEFANFDNYSALPILYYDVLSSHARSCQMLINILKIDVDLQLTDSINDVDFNETYTWINSYCRLPTLVDGNLTLCNGHSILIYLCQKYAPKNLLNLCPTDYKMRQKLTSVLYYEGCILNRYLSNLLSDMLLVKYPNLDQEYHKRKVLRAYKSLNAFLNGDSFMIGNFLTIADIAIVSTVSALNIIFPISHDKFPKLYDWFHYLKKMDFYKCNEEGILKLCHILKTIAKFNYPSVINDEEQDAEVDVNLNKNALKTTRNNSISDSNDKEVFENATTSSMKQKERSKSTKEDYGFARHKNDGMNQESEKYNFYDTYFINVSQCNCCANDESNKCFAHTTEIFRRPGTLEHLSSADEDFREIASHKYQCKNKHKSEAIKTSLRQVEKINIKSGKHQKSKENEIVLQSTGTESYEPSGTSISDNTEDEASGQRIKNKITHQNKVKPKLKDEGEYIKKVAEAEKFTSQAVTGSDKRCACCTKQEFQDLLEKVRKYEEILENSNKMLKNQNPKPTKILPDTSSIDSMTKGLSRKEKLPFKCNVTNSTCQQKHQQCDCHKKHKRTTSKIEALECDATVPIVLPKFLVTNSEKQSENCNSPKQIEAGKRLEAGTNINPYGNRSFCNDFLGFTRNLNHNYENSDDNMSQASENIAKIIYFLCTKNNDKTKVKCHCERCCRSGKTRLSKIPRLVSHGPLVNDKFYKISQLSPERFGCSFGNM